MGEGGISRWEIIFILFIDFIHNASEYIENSNAHDNEQKLYFLHPL